MLHPVAKFNLGKKGEYFVHIFVKGDSGDGSNLEFTELNNVKYLGNSSNLLLNVANESSSAVVRFKKNTSGKRKLDFVYFRPELYAYTIHEVAPRSLTTIHAGPDLWSSYEKGIMTFEPGYWGYPFARNYQNQFPKNGPFDYTFRFSINLDSASRIFTLRMVAYD